MAHKHVHRTPVYCTRIPVIETPQFSADPPGMLMHCNGDLDNAAITYMYAYDVMAMRLYMRVKVQLNGMKSNNISFLRYLPTRLGQPPQPDSTSCGLHWLALVSHASVMHPSTIDEI